jgi:ribosomal protein S18 acetylase RimI-like enzyme
MSSYHIQIITPFDESRITEFLVDRWGSTQLISRGLLHDGAKLPGFLAIYNNQLAGLITYNLQNDQCEITSLDSLVEGIGIGTGLIEAVRSAVLQTNCFRLWLITTNDNTSAIRFYQKRGFHLVAVHPNAVQQSRKIKTSIPLTGFDDIPIRDEIEFEIWLQERN